MNYLLLFLIFVVFVCLLLSIIDCFFSTNIYRTKEKITNKNIAVGIILSICLVFFTLFTGTGIIRWVKYESSAIRERQHDHASGYGTLIRFN